MSDAAANKPARPPAKIAPVKAKAPKPATPPPTQKRVAAAAAAASPTGTAPKPTRAMARQAAYGNAAVARSLERERAGGAPAPTRVKVDTSGGQALLDSVARAPASQFPTAVGDAVGAEAQVNARERDDLKKSYPEIDRPSGIPRKPRPPKVPWFVERGQAPDPEHPSEPGTEPPLPEDAQYGPNPVEGISTDVEEPLLDRLAAWWSWLVDVVRSFLAALPMTDEDVDTSAGDRPRVHLSGSSDPAQNQHNLDRARQGVGDARARADGATNHTFGENDVAPTTPEGKLRPSRDPAVRAAKTAKAMAPAPMLPSKERAEFDEHAGPLVSRRADIEADKHRVAQEKFARDAQQIRQDGDRELAAEIARTRGEQVGAKMKGIADVEAERAAWREANHKVADKFDTDAEEQRKQTDKQIDDQVKATNQQVDTQYDAAEKQAAEEKRKAEARAEELRKQEEDKDESWWDTFKGAVKSAFNAIRSAFRAVWDGLRKVVRGIIDGVKKLVHGLIEMARAAIIGLIHGFGMLLKGLVTLALAAFPDEAKKARAAIDRAVGTAERAVNDFADELERRCDQILDAVGDALDAALGVLEDVTDFCLGLMEDLALLVIGALEVVWKLLELLTNIGPFLDGVKKIYDDPGILIDGIKKAIGDMMGGIAEETEKWVRRAISGAERHLAGIWRHLEPKLAYLRDHWWDAIKQAGWDLLWPWPGVVDDFKKIWQAVKDGWNAVWALDADAASDAILAIWRGLNGVAGRLYGWFFIASVLVGAILGGIFGVGAGAIPGAIAGAAFAAEVGEGLLASTVGAETLTILNAGRQLLGGARPEKDEDNYEAISSSGLTLAITGVMFVLGALAVKFASAVISSAARALGVDLQALARGARVNVEPKAPTVEPKAPTVEPKAPTVEPTAPAAEPTAPTVDPTKPPPGQDVPPPRPPTVEEPAPAPAAKQPTEPTTPSAKQPTEPTEPTTPKATEELPPEEGPATAADPLSEGAKMARASGYPDAEPGYHWAKVNGKLVYRRNPIGMGPKRPPRTFDPETGKFGDIPEGAGEPAVEGENPQTTAEKGRFGERKADDYMADNGFVKRGSHDAPAAGGGKPKPQGIDGVYENTNPPPKWVVAEAKYGSSTYGELTDGTKQMSEQWVLDRLEHAVGRKMADQIIAEKFVRWELRVAPDGTVTQSVITWP